jgi:hypothetical protein
VPARLPPFKPQSTGDIRFDRLQETLAAYLAQVDSDVQSLRSPLAALATKSYQVTDQALVDYRGPGGHVIGLPFAAAAGKGRGSFVHVLNNGAGSIIVAALGGDTVNGARLLTMEPGTATLAMANGAQAWNALQTANDGPPVVLTNGPFWHSVVDSAAVNGAVSRAGNFTVGMSCIPSRALTCTGVRFFWQTAGSAKTVRCRVYGTSGSLASVDVAVNATGIYTGTFASPLNLTAYAALQVSAWETTGARYTDVIHTVFSNLTSDLRLNYTAHPYIFVTQHNRFKAGDASPDSNAPNEGYAVEPIVDAFPLE